MNGYIIYFIGFIIATCIVDTVFHYDNNSNDLYIFSLSLICGALWFGFIPLLLLYGLCKCFKIIVDKIIKKVKGW